jgi:hypothetical protein
MCHPPLHVRTETDPISDTLCSLEYRTVDKVKTPSNFESSLCFQLTLTVLTAMSAGVCLRVVPITSDKPYFIRYSEKKSRRVRSGEREGHPAVLHYQFNNIFSCGSRIVLLVA